MWHIAKRELYDNLNSLRFALTTVLLLALMLTNAVVHLREQPARIQKYLTAVTDARNALEARADSLYGLAQKGPGKLHKKPSDLHFCAEGGDPFLSGAVEADHHFWEYSSEYADLKSFWQMRYPAATSNLTNIRPDVTKIDWAFIIGYVLSLIALLFTFDAVTGERESGTLRLMLANSVPRHTVLIGKFLGALMSISIPFVLAVLINLLAFHVKCYSSQCRCVGTLRHCLFCRPPVLMFISGVRSIGIYACAAECGESCDTSTDVGYPCGFHAQRSRANCQRLFLAHVER